MPYKRNFKHIRESKPRPRTSLKKSKYSNIEDNVNFLNEKNEINFPKEIFSMNQASCSDYQPNMDLGFLEKSSSDEVNYLNYSINQTNLNNSTQILQVNNELEESADINKDFLNGQDCNEFEDDFDQNQGNEFEGDFDQNLGNEFEGDFDQNQDNEFEGDFDQNQFNEDLLKFLSKINDKKFFEKNFESALVGLYLSGKFSQTGFRLLCQFLKLVVKEEFKPPNDINRCIERLIDDDKLNFEKNWFCQNCLKIFTKINNKFINTCPDCSLKLQMNYIISIEQQIRRIFERNQYLYTHKNEINDSGILGDFHDGQIFKSVYKKERVYNNNPRFYTLLFNTDGIEMCNKSDISLWPFMFVLNEIPIEERYSFENVIIAGLSVSNGKPNLNILLEKIKQELKCLELGINLLDGNYQIFKFYVVSGVFDKPARSSIISINSSNGYYSCLRCLQSGKNIPTEKGSTIIYPYKSCNPTGPQRSIELYKRHLKKSLKNKTMIAGIKDDSILNDLKYYNAIKNTNVDIMHSLFLGVVKKFFEYWFEHPSYNQYSLKDCLSELDNRLLSIKPPSYVSSLPRSLRKWRKWRSHDFMNFTIHYSLITFSNLMPFEYFQNYMLFVIAIENLFRKEIEKKNLEKIQKCIEKFVSQLAKLYNPNIMKSGVHELLHLTDLTKDFGPLNNINCFPFEELNRKITSLIHGQNLIGEEFIKLFNLVQKVSSINEKADETSIFFDFIKKYSIIKSSNSKIVKFSNGVVFKSAKSTIRNKFISDLISDKYGILIKDLIIFKSIVFNGVRYEQFHSKKRIGNYSIFDSESNNFGLIKAIIKINNEIIILAQKISILFNPFHFESEEYLASSLKICSLTPQYFLCNIVNLNKLFFQQIKNVSYVSSFQTNHLFS